MSLKIRLARAGSKKRPFYHIVIADARSPRDGRFIERLGSYNPMLAKDSGERVKLDADRAKHWLSVGAQATDRVARFLDDAGLLKRDARNNPQKAEPGAKAKDRAAARSKAVEDAAAAAKAAVEDAAAAAEAAAAAAKAAAEAPAAEAPVEEAPVEAPGEEAPAEAAEETAAE